MMRPVLGAVVALTCVTGVALSATAQAPQQQPISPDAAACPSGYTIDPTLGRDGIFYQGHTCWRLSVAPDPTEVRPESVGTPEDVDPMRADGVGRSGRMTPDMPRMYQHQEEVIVGSPPDITIKKKQ